MKVRDPGFEARLRAALRAHEARLPPELETRLADARQQAIAQGAGRRHPAWRVPVALAAGLLLALGLSLLRPQAVVAPRTAADFVLLVEDDPEFLADLEFYLWLESQDESG